MKCYALCAFLVACIAVGALYGYQCHSISKVLATAPVVTSALPQMLEYGIKGLAAGIVVIIAGELATMIIRSIRWSFFQHHRSATS
jgi:hypothetical protein